MASMINNILFNTDSYKVSMWKQYPPGTEYVYSYIMPRSNEKSEEVVFFGLQDFILNVLSVPVTKEQVLQANLYWTAHGEPFNLDGWMYIVEKHNGYLPIVIKAVEEGKVIPVKNVLLTVENTDPKVPWITTWVETALLRAIWYPSSVATLSRNIKKIINEYLERTGDVSGLPFKLHDFGARGVSSKESAALAGAAHLINFMGTDTFVSVIKAMESYDGELNKLGFSIPAAEHSTITSWGRANETAAFGNMVTQFSKPGSIYAVVSDSFNIYEAVKNWCSEPLKSKVINSGGLLVIRPDSGDPLLVVPELLDMLGNSYGYTINEKGYKVLNNVRLIWGDGINAYTIERILEVMMDDKWSADNMAFGMGGALLQGHMRDDLGWAMKCSSIIIDGVMHNVSKDPVDSPEKKSLAGRVSLFKDVYGKYYTGVEDWMKSELDVIFKNGKLIKRINFEKIRENAKL